jgi:hypothetical protein
VRVRVRVRERVRATRVRASACALRTVCCALCVRRVRCVLRVCMRCVLVRAGGMHTRCVCLRALYAWACAHVRACCERGRACLSPRAVRVRVRVRGVSMCGRRVAMPATDALCVCLRALFAWTCLCVGTRMLCRACCERGRACLPRAVCGA